MTRASYGKSLCLTASTGLYRVRVNVPGFAPVSCGSLRRDESNAEAAGGTGGYATARTLKR
jgi:hypothetical protein